MKINIALGVVISMIITVFLLMVIEIAVSVISNLDLSDHVALVLLSILALVSQIVWIKNEPKGWIKMMDKVFGVKISTN